MGRKDKSKKQAGPLERLRQHFVVIDDDGDWLVYPSQGAWAEQLGVDPGEYSKAARGVVPIPTPWIVRILIDYAEELEALGIDVKELDAWGR